MSDCVVEVRDVSPRLLSIDSLYTLLCVFRAMGVEERAPSLLTSNTDLAMFLVECLKMRLKEERRRELVREDSSVGEGGERCAFFLVNLPMSANTLLIEEEGMLTGRVSKVCLVLKNPIYGLT